MQRLKPADQKEETVVKKLENSALYKKLAELFAVDGNLDTRKAWVEIVLKLKAQLVAEDYTILTFHNHFKDFLLDLCDKQASTKAQIEKLFSAMNESEVQGAIQECFSHAGRDSQFGLPLRDRKVRAIYEYSRMLLVLAASFREAEIMSSLKDQQHDYEDARKALQNKDIRNQSKFTESDVTDEIRNGRAAAVGARVLLFGLAVKNRKEDVIARNDQPIAEHVQDNVIDRKNEKIAAYKAELADIRSKLAAMKADTDELLEAQKTYQALKHRYDALIKSLAVLQASLQDAELIKEGLEDPESAGEECVYFSAQTIDSKVAALKMIKVELECDLAELRARGNAAKRDLEKNAAQDVVERDRKSWGNLAQIDKFKKGYDDALVTAVRMTSEGQSSIGSNPWGAISQLAVKPAWSVTTEEAPAQRQRKHVELVTSVKKWVDFDFAAIEKAYFGEMEKVDHRIKEWEGQRAQRIPTSEIFAETDTIKAARVTTNALITDTSANSNLAKQFEKTRKTLTTRAAEAARVVAEEADVLKAAHVLRDADIEAQQKMRDLTKALDSRARPESIVKPPIEDYLVKEKTLWERTPIEAKIVLGVCAVIPLLLWAGICSAHTYFNPPKTVPTSPKSAPLPSRLAGAGSGPDGDRGEGRGLHRVSSEPNLSTAAVNKGTGATLAQAERGHQISSYETAAKALVINKLEGMVGKGYTSKVNHGSRKGGSNVTKLINWQDVGDNKLKLINPPINLVINAAAGEITIGAERFLFTCQVDKSAKLSIGSVERFHRVITDSINALERSGSAGSVLPAIKIAAQP